MAMPAGGDNPSRYKPNPVDDRALTGTPASAVYLSLSIAIEEIESIYADRAAFMAQPPNVRRPIRAADSALRRAAFGVVLYAAEKTGG